MDIFNSIAEQKITEAIARGEFDDLKLKGQKLDLTVDPMIPPELRMGLKILKNAGIIPEELQIDKEIRSLRELLNDQRLDEQHNDIRNEIKRKMLQLNILHERNGRSPALQDYLDKLESVQG